MAPTPPSASTTVSPEDDPPPSYEAPSQDPQPRKEFTNMIDEGYYVQRIMQGVACFFAVAVSFFAARIVAGIPANTPLYKASCFNLSAGVVYLVYLIIAWKVRPASTSPPTARPQTIYLLAHAIWLGVWIAAPVLMFLHRSHYHEKADADAGGSETWTITITTTTSSTSTSPSTSPSPSSILDKRAGYHTDGTWRVENQAITTGVAGVLTLYVCARSSIFFLHTTTATLSLTFKRFTKEEIEESGSAPGWKR